MQRDGQTVLAECGAQTARGEPAVATLAEHLFARPDHLDGLAGKFLRDRDDQPQVVGEIAPAEMSAEHRRMQRHVLERHVRFFGGDQIRLRLDRAVVPHLDLPVGDARGGVQRLDRRLIGERREIGGLDDAAGSCGARPSASPVSCSTFSPGVSSRASTAAFICSVVFHLRALAVVPFDRHRFERLARLPVVFGDDGHGALRAALASLSGSFSALRGSSGIHDRDADDARHVLDGVEVVALEPAAVHRRLHERAVHHAGHLDVDAVGGRAGDDLRIDELARRACPAEQLDVLVDVDLGSAVV